MSGVLLEGVGKTFGDVTAVASLDLEIREGEFVTLLGPSGCGKTTTLRMIAGFERPTSGRISIGEQVVFDKAASRDVPPEKRHIGMVFQSYAVWPNRTVFGNVSYPLKIRKVGKSDLRSRTEDALAAVGLKGLDKRYPHELSGGQQQRVALARALVAEPRVMLLDEPLSNLDAKLREQMRVEIKELQQRLGITIVYVTHDQLEAMAMSDRIVVMRDGIQDQIAEPETVYQRPATPYVADFIGATNLVNGIADNGAIQLEGAPSEFRLETKGCPSGPVVVSIRPEAVTLTTGSTGNLGGIVERATFLGSAMIYLIKIGGLQLRVTSSTLPKYEEGTKLGLVIGDWTVFPASNS